jgi:hypothetical protein
MQGQYCLPAQQRHSAPKSVCCCPLGCSTKQRTSKNLVRLQFTAAVVYKAQLLVTDVVHPGTGGTALGPSSKHSNS